MDFELSGKKEGNQDGDAGNRADVLIIGGGPAGLSAAIYNARAGFSVVVLEKLVPGGQIFSTAEIENFPGIDRVTGPELSEVMEAQAKKFGARIVFDEVIAIGETPDGLKEITCASGSTYAAAAVIIAVGATYKHLGVPGESQFRGHGVSNCATCDGAFYRNKEVAVVGGGDTAVEEGLFLTKFATKVYVVHRRNRLRANPAILARARENDKMEFIFDSTVEEIRGADTVSGVSLKNIKTGEKRELRVDGVFVFIGLRPGTDFLRGVLELDPQGYVKTDREMQASRPGIFACGDCTDKSFRQVITAAGDGANAAFAAQHYIERLQGTEYK
jgi:thioredoxin reductase (NADPH)